MFGISLPELLLIFVLILVVLGPEKIPEVARWIGKGLREVRKASNLMRDALMLDDDEGFEKRRALPKKNVQPTTPSAPPPAAEAPISAPEPKAAAVRPAPAPRPIVEPPSVALDQAGEDFDRALDAYFNAPYSELIKVPLHPAQLPEGATGLVCVPLKPASSPRGLTHVSLDHRAQEIAS
jgi:TatA/E family protein of Tat protein translocase